MKKKLILLSIMCILMFSFVGCDSTSYQEAIKPNNSVVGNGYFTAIKRWTDSDGGYYTIVYANDTKVMYIIQSGSYESGMSPLYNADGTLQVYDNN